MIPLICLCFALSTGHEPAISMTATPVQTPVAFHGHDLIAVGPAEQQAYAAGAPREDGWQHLLASFVATSIAGSVARAAGLSPHESVYVGAAVGMTVGIGKELRDHYDPAGDASLHDLLWDAAGVGAAAAVLSQVR